MASSNIFSKTRKHLIRTNLLVFGFFLALFGILIYTYFYSLTEKRTNEDIRRQTDRIIRDLQRGWIAPPPPLMDITKGFIVLFWKEGVLLNQNFQNDIDIVIKPPTKSTSEPVIERIHEQGHQLKVLTQTGPEGITIQVIKIFDIEYRLLDQLIFVLISGIIISLIALYFISVYLTKKALTPIKKSWDNQALFIQDASHELRTPLTVISAKLEAMLQNPEHTVSDEIENIAYAMSEVRSLRKLVKDLLDLSKEDAIIKLNLTTVDAVEIMEEIFENYQEIAKMQQKAFTIKGINKSMYITTDIQKFKQLISIFIDNALKYTSKQDEITISLQEVNQGIQLSISDTGIGIPKEELSNLFHRFFRASNVRDKEIDGAGIGLAIGNVILGNLNGKIHVTSEVGVGTTFDIFLPKRM